MAPASDQAPALVEAARKGDADAFRQLFRLHVGAVRRLVYRLVGSSPDLDDLVQTVFVEGFKSLPTFRGESLFSTWLGRIAVRITMRSVTRPRPHLEPLELVRDIVDEGARPDEAAAHRESVLRIDDLLSSLKPKKRAAFVLHALEGYSIEETAAIVGASAPAVKLQVSEARRELERKLRNDPRFASRIQRGRTS
jgi:RNA polymerase sigma-70 factor, ECF subfamily